MTKFLISTPIMWGVIIFNTMILSAPTRAGTQDEFVELAPYMAELQQLTHKVSLSIAHNNTALAEFYMYESLEVLNDTQENVPEYRGQAIALMIDRISKPAYDQLKKALASYKSDRNKADLETAHSQLIESCNTCHKSTNHEFIKIINRGDFNPFNQDFRP